jgi:autotransporter-associated beta strand protein
MGGGTFNYSRTGAGQTVNGLTLNAGNSTVNNTSSGQTLNLGAITRTGSAYGTLNFATLTGSISTTTGNTNGIIGTWATTGSTTTLRYAVGSADGVTPTNISALTGTTATANLANVTDATANYEYSAAATLAGSRTANTLRYSGGANTTALGASNTLTLNGLMQAGTGALTISGGPSTGGILIGSTGELVITANAQNTTISAVIAGSGGRLVYAGGGTLALGGANTFDGGLVINSGTVAVSADANAGAGSITINRAGTLSTNNAAYSREITLNGGTLAIGANGASSGPFSGDISLAANSTISTTNTNSGVGRISGSMLGTGGFTKTGTGGLQLNATSNTYTGPTVVSTGGLTVKSSLYGNDTAQWTPANITVASNATFVLNVGGTGEFTTTQAATMFTNLATGVTNNGLLAGSIIGVDTRNADAGTYTYSGVISDSAGPGGGAVGFKHSGKGSTILEMTGANTYSGPTFRGRQWNLAGLLVQQRLHES